MFLSAIIFPLVSDIYQVLLSNSPQDFFMVCLFSTMMLVKKWPSKYWATRILISLLTKHWSFRSMNTLAPWPQNTWARHCKKTPFEKLSSFLVVMKHKGCNRFIKFIQKWLRCTILSLLVVLCTWRIKILFLKF